MKRIVSTALAMILTASPVLAAQPSAPPAPPSATHTGTVGLYLGNAWFAPADAMVNLADVQAFQKGNFYDGQWLASSFTANQISFDSRFSNFLNQTGDGNPPSFRLPNFLQSSYGGPPNTGMVAVALTTEMSAQNMPFPNGSGCMRNANEHWDNLPQFNGTQCAFWIEAKGTISLGPYDTVWIAHDGGVMLRASQADPVTDPNAWVAPFRAVVAGGIVCEQATFGKPTGSYNVDLIYQQTNNGNPNNGGTPAVLAMMIIPQGSPMPTCQ